MGMVQPGGSEPGRVSKTLTEAEAYASDEAE